MLSSTSKHPLALEDFGKRSVLEPGLGGPVGRPLDERPAHVAVAHQALDRRNLQCERHGVGRGLGCVGNGNDDRVGVKRHCLQAAPALFRARIG